MVGAQLIPATALADPEPAPRPQADPAVPGDQEILHNIIYRARADGTFRVERRYVAYKMDDQNVRQRPADAAPRAVRSRSTPCWPTPKQAGMRVVDRLAVRIESALRDPGRRPDRRAGRSVHRAAAVPRRRTTRCTARCSAAPADDIPVAQSEAAPPRQPAAPGARRRQQRRSAAYGLAGFPGTPAGGVRPRHARARTRRGTTAPWRRRNPWRASASRLAAR